jgi:carbamoyltransferase
LRDGELVFAVEEERLSRVKHCAGFPALAARACLQGMDLDAIDHVAVSRDPSANLFRKILSVLGGSAPPQQLAARLGNAARLRSVADDLGEVFGKPPRARIHAVEHHRAHLASAFFASPFDEAAVLSLDGFGDFSSTMWAHGRGRSIEVLGQVHYPHSLGILYTAATQWLGFPHYGDEGKVMGLAPFGRPRFADTLRAACRVAGDAFELDTRWFTHATEGAAMTWKEGTPVVGRLWSHKWLEELGPAREPGQPLTDLHRDVAASVQAVVEEIIFHLARALHRRTGSPRLCLAGGVAFNSVANGKLRNETPFRDIFVQPAAGDAGTALGAALYVEHVTFAQPRRFVMRHAYTGPEYSERDCEAAIERAGLTGVEITRTRETDQLVDMTSAALADRAITGWFQGRMEFGARALGNRSVLCDPRRGEMVALLNRRIKHRESFRPFAPAILSERAADWLAHAQPSPAMTMVLPVRTEKRALVPAIVHVDGTARAQTVEREANPLFYALIEAFERRTGVPMLLNTSFNENEPIVCAPDDALACFARTEMDLLALGPFLIRKLVR